MQRIGVTGGIGAGKSLVCQIFECLGYPVYNADAQAKKLMVENENLKRRIIDLFGPESYLPNGEYNREWVGQKVFADKQRLQALNHLVHPAVHSDANKWFENQSTPYALYEAALIIEGGRHDMFDAIICVTAPEQLRIKRVMKRNGFPREKVLDRIENQSTDQEKRKYCHFEIINDEQHFLIPQVLNVDKIILGTSTFIG